MNDPEKDAKILRLCDEYDRSGHRKFVTHLHPLELADVMGAARSSALLRTRLQALIEQWENEAQEPATREMSNALLLKTIVKELKDALEAPKV
jgi:hypothetical protein